MIKNGQNFDSIFLPKRDMETERPKGPFESFWSKEMEEKIKKNVVLNLKQQDEDLGNESSLFEQKDVIDRRFEEEKVFCQKVLDNLGKFVMDNGQEDSLVLWDISGTLLHLDPNVNKLYVRESVPSLVGFIGKRYPGLKQGILSDIPLESIKELLSGELSVISGNISPEEVYSVSRHDYQSVFASVGMKDYEIPKEDYVFHDQKAVLAKKIEENGRKVFAIDDLPWAKDSGLGIQTKSITLRYFEV